MKLAVTGGRNYHDQRAVYIALNRIHREEGIDLLLEGGATGADALARQWAESNGIPVATFHANWKAKGNGAGHARNWAMIKYGEPDLLLAFPGGRGTANCVEAADRCHVRVKQAADINLPASNDLGAGV